MTAVSTTQLELIKAEPIPLADFTAPADRPVRWTTPSMDAGPRFGCAGCPGCSSDVLVVESLANLEVELHNFSILRVDLHQKYGSIIHSMVSQV